MVVRGAGSVQLMQHDGEMTALDCLVLWPQIRHWGAARCGARTWRVRAPKCHSTYLHRVTSWRAASKPRGIAWKLSTRSALVLAWTEEMEADSSGARKRCTDTGGLSH